MTPAWLRTTTPPEHERLSKSLPSRLHVINMGPTKTFTRKDAKVTPEVLARMRELDKTMPRVQVARELKLAACTVTRILGWKHEVKRTRFGLGKVKS